MMAVFDDANPADDPREREVMLDRAADWLRSSRVVAFPTETVYGLGAAALDERAVSLVFALKGRPAYNPLIVHVDSVAMARGICSVWPDAAQRLADRFWPGPLTMVLPRAGVVPTLVTAGGESVAVRMPNHALSLGLIARFGGPIVGPSANRSGTVSPTTAEHVRQAFGDDERVMILDGGPCAAGIESTVVRLAEDRCVVLRRGVIGADAIAETLGQVVDAAGEAGTGSDAAADQPLLSPGMLSRHYAPATRAALIHRGGAPGAWLSGAETAERIVVIGSEEGSVIARAALGSAVVRVIVMPPDASRYAQRLYAALREADQAGADAILIEQPGAGGELWEAIRDRLKRATTPA